MPVYRLKPRFQAVLRPVARRLHALGATANQITLAAAVGSFLLGAATWTWGVDHPRVWWLLPPWLLVRMALNAIDGLLAREWGQTSAKGAYLNELGDAVSDAVLVAPLARIAPLPPEGVALFVVVASWAELAGVLGATVGASRRHDGPFGKSDRALFLAGLAAWIGWGPLPAWAAWIPFAAAAAAGLTVMNRVGQGLLERRTR